MTSKHIVQSYDKDLSYLNNQIAEMGQLVTTQLVNAVDAVVNGDNALAQKVIAGDPKVDKLEHKIDDFAIRMIALRQPMAEDLRAIIAAIKVSSHLERMADYAKNIARRFLALSKMSQIPSINVMRRMTEMAVEMIKDVVDAYIERDDEQAYAIWQRDVNLDEMYISFLRELLTYMMEDPRNIGASTELLFIAKNIERIGDHSTNIAEMVHYQIYGVPFEEPRPKGVGG